jgi:ketosteroid isomerase-like protein
LPVGVGYGAAMSASNQDLTQHGVDALLRGDLDGVEELLAPEIEWVWFEPGGTDLIGRDAVVQAFRERVEEDILGGLLDLVADDDDVLVCLAPSARAAEGGVAAAWTRVCFRDGLVIRLVSYDSRERAFAGA